jgi:formylglycine-generating enzyme required for sulfatase activity
MKKLTIFLLAIGAGMLFGCQGSSFIEMVSVKGNGEIKNFKIGKYEITQAQWQAVMGNNPSEFVGDDLPVGNVSWDDVQEFLSKLNATTGKNYRLPTYSEWKYAASGGNKSKGYKYSGSNNSDEVAWYNDNSDGKPHPVGTKAPNELGIYDMSGNVYEWCQDGDDQDRVYCGDDWNCNGINTVDNCWHHKHYGRSSSGIGFRVVLQ